MINKLRRKFIAIAMCSMVLVLGCIVAAMNIMNYWNVNEDADRTLNIISDNGGVFPKDFSDQGNMQGQKPDDLQKKKPPVEMSPEAPFETRYFTVEIDSTGNVSSVNTGKIAAVSDSDAKTMAENLYSKNKTNGFINNYKYRLIDTQSGKMYIFLDCNQRLQTFYSFLITSVVVSFGGIVLVFLLVLIFSKLAVKPVAESYQKQKRFITDASHEIKTPLTIIDANTEVLNMEYGENEWLKSTSNQVKRLTKFTERLVFLSRMDEEREVLQKTDFSISDAVYEATKPFKAMAKSQNKTLNISVQPNVSYYGDESSIIQLVSLLLENAMKYSDDEGTVSLKFCTNGKNKVLSVKNTVEEIQKGRLDMLFDRFYRTDKSRNSQTGGFGIGLSVAKAIVNAHKGKITAVSADGKSIEITAVL
ncbi:MAG: HAMP domain-containing histidine kinase [Ruminococcus sp.]|nr:HAMP domain-containing histidine kinase [Ruminococcus sp.]MDY2856877.1 HAMP domain-containing sensor histidine kinase [Oscillospiraceae bacterium]